MTATILSIGDELVLGQTVDTNTAWLAGQLAAVGISVVAHVTVPDDQAAIVRAIAELAGRCDVLLVTGGLGPTPDDLTRQALADVLGTPLELDVGWLAEIEAFFQRRQRPMPPSNRIQAMIPRGARLLPNPRGTAPGIAAEHGPCRIYVMPGVPAEMVGMFEAYILPELAALGGGSVIQTRTLHTFGLGESLIAERLGDLMDRRRNPTVGTTVSGGVVSLRLRARFDSAAEARAQLSLTETLCRQRLGPLIYGADGTTLAQVVFQMLAERSGAAPLTVATAESCTGGLLAGALTDIPGSSRYFRQGWVTYSNEAKTRMLGVDSSLLAEHGAVSEPVVRAMAAGALQRAGTDFALAVSGIAGPDGGTAAKPVGMVCIALAAASGAQVGAPGSQAPIAVSSRTFHFPGDRATVRDRSVKTALSLLRFHLLGLEHP